MEHITYIGEVVEKLADHSSFANPVARRFFVYIFKNNINL